MRIYNIDPKCSAPSTFISWIWSPYETGNEDLSRGLALVSSAGRSVFSAADAVRGGDPGGEDIIEGFCNRWPVECGSLCAGWGFSPSEFDHIDSKSYRLSVDNYAPVRRRNYLSPCPLYDHPCRNYYLLHRYRQLAAVQSEVNRFHARLNI